MQAHACLQAPDFYERVPPAPPGLEWWKYRSDVPPLPQPSKYFHSKKYAGWGARRTTPCAQGAELMPIFLLTGSCFLYPPAKCQTGTPSVLTDTPGTGRHHIAKECQKCMACCCVMQACKLVH